MSKEKVTNQKRRSSRTRKRSLQAVGSRTEAALVTEVERGAGGTPQPTYADLWDAFVFGAREARMNPTATEKDFNRAADGYCKLIHSEKDPAMFAVLAGAGRKTDDTEPRHSANDRTEQPDSAKPRSEAK